MATVSLREHIRWGSDPASEPTSTIVLSSPARRFVDIRVFKTALARLQGKNLGNTHTIPKDQLDWALAGHSTSAPAAGEHGTPYSHSVFHHWVDSRSKDPEGIFDEGDMYPRPDGLTLELGRMVNPDTGTEMDYEELWRDEEPEYPAGQPVKCIVFSIQDDSQEKRGQFIMLGRYAQGILRVGDLVTAERWEWDQSAAGWKKLFSIGDGGLGSLDGLINGDWERRKQGDLVDTRHGKWTVSETSDLRLGVYV